MKCGHDGCDIEHEVPAPPTESAPPVAENKLDQVIDAVGGLTETVDKLVAAVAPASGEGETVASEAGEEIIDSTPVRRPWTHVQPFKRGDES